MTSLAKTAICIMLCISSAVVAQTKPDYRRKRVPAVQTGLKSEAIDETTESLQDAWRIAL